MLRALSPDPSERNRIVSWRQSCKGQKSHTSMYLLAHASRSMAGDQLAYFGGKLAAQARVMRPLLTRVFYDRG